MLFQIQYIQKFKTVDMYSFIAVQKSGEPRMGGK